MPARAARDASRDTKSRLVAAAASLFKDRGYHNVSVQDLVEAVGLTKGAFYHHLSSKEELLFLVLDEYMTYALERARLIYHGDYHARWRVGLFVHDILDAVDRYQAHVTVFFQEYKSLRPEDMRRIESKRREFRELLCKTLQLGMADGTFRRDLDVSVTSLAIIGMASWCYRWYRQDGRMSAAQIADHLLALVMPGLERTSEDRPRLPLPPVNSAEIASVPL
jgi:AcrR family transcriptional regulator